MPGVRMSDLHSVQFDVRDGDDEVVSISSDIYINYPIESEWFNESCSDSELQDSWW